MAEIHDHKPQNSLPYLLFVLQFFSLQLLCESYALPDKFFINCGSQTNVTAKRRTFFGDSSPGNSDSFTFTRQSSSVQDSNKSNSSPLYQTARVFNQKSSYEFDVSSNGTYLVRLHFFAFSSQYDLSTALFDVSASGFTLLHNFSMEKNTSSSAVIKEYFLSISSGKFMIDFLPKVSLFAFVNAIEVFLVPESFIPDDAPGITRAGRNDTYNGILSDALETVQRINVGGSLVTPDNDTLFRTWIPDDSFLYNPDAAKNSFYSSRPAYWELVSEYNAPDYIYQTAKEMNTNGTDSIFNITWSFDVSKNSKHFVRLHFCDIVSSSLASFLFNLYIYSNFRYEINPYESNSRLASPFYHDFVVDSEDSGLMNISIGPRSDSISKNAFLNGLEIMEILKGSGSEARRNEHKKTNAIVVVGSVVGGLAFIIFFAVGCCFRLRWRKVKNIQSLDWSPASTRAGGSSDNRVSMQPVISPVLPSLNLGLKMTFADVLYATNNFNETMIIGKGGFGNVFRGTLRNGMIVAVKRSKPGSGQGFFEFQTEIMVLSKIRHRHLVSLIGYCDERSEMILVYEFMEKGTLRDHLYGSASPPLSWNQRLEICIGAAKGLHYLHKGCARGFIHRDIKSTNILLDQSLVAKVADFGLSRLGGPDNTHVSTDVKGTFGYLDPDYFRTQQLTEKSDVYSFGVVLLEVLCARPALNTSLPMEQVNLAEWGIFCKTKGTLDHVIDATITNQINPNSLRKFVETAEKCLQEYGADRPTMADVLWDLEYALQLQQTPRLLELQDYSIADASSSVLNVPKFETLPSFSMSMERDDMAILAERMSDRMEESKVFSQLKIDDAR